jgi:hypothetical protein
MDWRCRRSRRWPDFRGVSDVTRVLDRVQQGDATWRRGGVATSSGDSNVLYRNNGNGTFTQITSGVVPSDVGYSLSVAGGDYDNDGLPNLFFGGAFGPASTVASLFYHTGGGNFERITDGTLANTLGNFIASWVDYDNDGLLDIFLANTGGRLSH